MDNHIMTELMIRYEEQGLNEEETIQLFQYLVDTGLAWTLQGFYGRQAMALIEMGAVTRPTEPKASDAIREAVTTKPKLKRGRKSTKQVGALVTMRQRRIQGQGIILERVEDVPYDGHTDYHSIIVKMKQAGYVGYGVLDSEHHNFVLVQWVSPPSDYSMEKSHFTKQWYPDKWLKVVSPAAKVYCEKEKDKN